MIKELDEIKNNIQIEILKDSIKYAEYDKNGYCIWAFSKVMKAKDFRK